MKTLINQFLKHALFLSLCFFHMGFIQNEITLNISKLGKGIIYLKEGRIIKNIMMKEIKNFWIVYEKDGNLHDRMMDEISRIEFTNAYPQPVFILFENNTPVIKKLLNSHRYE